MQARDTWWYSCVISLIVSLILVIIALFVKCGSDEGYCSAYSRREEEVKRDKKKTYKKA